MLIDTRATERIDSYSIEYMDIAIYGHQSDLLSLGYPESVKITRRRWNDRKMTVSCLSGPIPIVLALFHYLPVAGLRNMCSIDFVLIL